MKPLITLALLCLLALSGCKKSDQQQTNTYSPLTVNISIAAPLRVDLKIVNQNGSILLSQSEVAADVSLQTLGVTHGDKLTMTFNTNLSNPQLSNGAIAFSFFYNGSPLTNFAGTYYMMPTDYSTQIVIP